MKTIGRSICILGDISLKWFYQNSNATKSLNDLGNLATTTDVLLNGTGNFLLNPEGYSYDGYPSDTNIFKLDKFSTANSIPIYFNGTRYPAWFVCSTTFDGTTVTNGYVYLLVNIGRIVNNGDALLTGTGNAFILDKQPSGAGYFKTSANTYLCIYIDPNNIMTLSATGLQANADKFYIIPII